MVEYGDHQEHVFLARDMGSPRNYSEATAQKIDAEVKRLIDNAYAKATELILAHRAKLDVIAKGLLEFETLDAKHIHEIMETGELTNPPSKPTPPDLPSIEGGTKKRTVEKEKEIGGDFPGELAPA